MRYLLLFIILLGGLGVEILGGGLQGADSVPSGAGDQPPAETRSLAMYNSLSVSGAFDIEWSPAQKYSAVIEAPTNLLPHIRTTVAEGLLKISSDDGVSVPGPIRIRLSGEAIKKINFAGTGTLVATGVGGPNVSVAITGSAGVTIAGQVKDLTASIMGDGTIEGEKLKSDSASITITGSGSGYLDVVKQLSVIISGSGSLTYEGRPGQVSQQVFGSGQVIAK